MSFTQILKTVFTGIFFGIGLVWLLAVIIPLIFGIDVFRFIREYDLEIISMSLYSGSVCGFLWIIVAGMNERRRKREELEDAMKEYFRKQAEKDN